MNPDELARYRVIAEQNRRLRRLCEKLIQQNAELRSRQSEASRAFDEDNAALFAIVHENHRVNAPLVQVFHFE